MNGLHTWSGLLVGSVLFAVFWMGSLAVFDKEIDQWMSPVLRIEMPVEELSFDLLRPNYDSAVNAMAPVWSLRRATERQPYINTFWREKGGRVSYNLDPRTGEKLPELGTLAGSRFIYPFHVDLHIGFMRLGYWLVGLAGMVMLLLCISGVIIHRKIFVDFFTFRIASKSRRFFLDMHNVTGVLGLPFHICITLSGLIIFYMVYFPSGWQAVYGKDAVKLSREIHGFYSRPKAGQAGTLSAIGPMIAQARALWNGEEPRSVYVWHPGDAAAYVQINRPVGPSIALPTEAAYFDAASGNLLHVTTPALPMAGLQKFIAGFHFTQFNHWAIRWLYFFLGLTGCLLIATGFIFWIESRRKRHEELGLIGFRVVEGIAIASTVGIIGATLAFFAANRILPPDASFIGLPRATAEAAIFYVVWGLGGIHVIWRRRSAWSEQCWLIAGLAGLAVLMNWLTTGDHILRAVTKPYLWPVAGMDILLLFLAVIAILIARKLKSRMWAVSTGSRQPALRSLAEGH